MTTSVFALFDRPEDVRKALAKLTNLGVPAQDITISSRDADTHQLVTQHQPEPVTTAGAAVGAAAGGVVGAVLTVAAGVAAGVAGPIFVLFGVGGSMLGAAYGSVAGAIVGTGYQLEHVKEVEQSLEGGKILLAVKFQPTQREKLETILSQAGGVCPQSSTATYTAMAIEK